MSLLLINIKKLIQIDEDNVRYRSGKEMMNLNSIENAFLFIDNGYIDDYGCMQDLSREIQKQANKTIDLSGKMLMPTFCDSHTHLVYAGSREIEYIDKIKGLSYEEIAKRGGGILNSAKLLSQTSEDELFEQSAKRVKEIMFKGTGAVEIKSGYGLNTENELKMLRVIRRIRDNFPLEVKSTFLGAHSIPSEYRNNRTGYVELIINEMIPLIAAEDLADYIDVFCDHGFFTTEDTSRILMAGIKHGMPGKIHANELALSGGIQTGVHYDALSVDHLEFTGEEEMAVLKNSSTMPTLLPGASFFLGMPWAPARKMIDYGLPVALASDFNPGSSPSGDMKFISSLGSIKLKMLPEEVINAVTVNSAYAMGVDHILGSISRGKLANLIITKEIPGIEYIPYAYTSDIIEEVLIKGIKIRNSL
jgi:imidazolonepropionase